MRLILFLIAIVGGCYFLYAKRRFDFLSLGFFAACVYFVPGFAGFVIYPDDSGNPGIRIPLSNEAVVIMAMVLAAILISVVAYDLVAERYVAPQHPLANTGHVTSVAILLGLIGFFMSAYTTGAGLLFVNKLMLLKELNRWHILWEYAAILGTVLAFSKLQWGYFAVGLILLIGDLVVGFRSAFAIAIISIFIVWISDKGRERFIVKHWKITLAGFFAAYLLFISKFFLVYVKSANFASMVLWFSQPRSYLDFNIVSVWFEPFTTQAILNAVTISGFSAGMGHFAYLRYLLIPFSWGAGSPPISFNALFQPALFPLSVSKYGMANNIWAEMFSSGSWPLLIAFIALFCFGLGFGSYWLRCRNAEIRALVAITFSLWAFYIHRNDILYQLTIERRIIAVWVLSMIGALVLNKAIHFFKSS